MGSTPRRHGPGQQGGVPFRECELGRTPLVEACLEQGVTMMHVMAHQCIVLATQCNPDRAKAML